MSFPDPAEVEALRRQPEFKALMDELAVEMEHLDPALYPKGDSTTKLDLFRMHLERMLAKGQEPRVHDWIVDALKAIDKQELTEAQFKYLDSNLDSTDLDSD